ncbi:GNAT family N-acetyltransferase [Bacillus cytotoxicus]|uniref:GNAT family N-acetyltransferase n=1 Tax=Bacillus cereus group sp. BfR-BA-01492 TaxID=2920361 RepID=UPI001F592AAB|nr:GNAT family N-acetyltransferase [Bacillus cereus group sp. BfR-BA-01492]EMA6342908.1 GNAT family N-acetyltransferase [Bacillus cytotoxicus]
MRKDIETKRLYMRPPSIGNRDEFYEIVKQEEVGKWLAVARGMLREEAEQYINQLISHWKQNGFGVWFLFHKISGELLGHCGLRCIDETEEVEIMYLLNPKFWGKGYATEAAYATIQYAIYDLKLTTFKARIKTENMKSRNLLEKIGFTYTHDRGKNEDTLLHFEYKYVD